MKKYLGFLLISGSLMATACSATVGEDADGTADGTADAGGTTDTTGGTDQDAGGDTTAAKATFKSVLIFDKSEDPTFVNGKCGSSPGTDLDAIGVWREVEKDKWQLMGVGRVGSANYDTSKASTCENKKNLPGAAEGPINGYVYKDKADEGYISLNGGSIEVEIGACQSANETIKSCDGKGAAVEIMDGDQIDIYEVDKSYLATGDGPGKGNAFDGCVCYEDEFQVMLRKEKGVDAGSIFLGNSDGSTVYKGTQSGELTKQNTISVKVP